MRLGTLLMCTTIGALSLIGCSEEKPRTKHARSETTTTQAPSPFALAEAWEGTYVATAYMSGNGDEPTTWTLSVHSQGPADPHRLRGTLTKSTTSTTLGVVSYTQTDDPIVVLAFERSGTLEIMRADTNLPLARMTFGPSGRLGNAYTIEISNMFLPASKR